MKIKMLKIKILCLSGHDERPVRSLFVVSAREFLKLAKFL